MRRAVAVDLSGVLADTSRAVGGSVEGLVPLPGAMQFTRDLSAHADVIIVSLRATAEFSGLPQREAVAAVTSWLQAHGFAFREVFAGVGKPNAAAYIDNRAVACRPNEDPYAYAWALAEALDLVDDGTLDRIEEDADGAATSPVRRSGLHGAATGRAGGRGAEGNGR